MPLVIALAWTFVAFPAVCSAQEECAGDCPVAAGSKGLLQVHQVTSLHEDEPTSVCVVQDGRCFDMTMEPSWDEVHPDDKELMEGMTELQEDESVHTFSSEQVELVVTRSGEDLRWLNALPQLPATVYNRGGPDSLLPRNRSNLRIVHQDNVGREDEAMLRHIVQRYDSLPDITVFLQGWPFGHCPGLLRSVRRAVSAMLDKSKLALLAGSGGSVDGLIPLSGTFWQYNVPEGKVGLAREIAESHSDTSANAKLRAIASYSDLCSKVLGGAECPGLQWTSEGAQWAVSRDRIRSTAKHIYQEGLSLGEGFESKYRGLVYEALWPVLWDAKDWKPTKVRDVPQVAWAFKRARSLDSHCLGDNGKRSLLFSCRDRPEFCERRRQMEGELSQDFQAQRSSYQVSLLGEPWQVMVEIENVIWGDATWVPKSESGPPLQKLPTFVPKVIAAEGGLLQLKPTESGSNGNFSGADKEPVAWAVEAQGKSLLFTTQASSGETLYLGCGSAGNAKLTPQKFMWQQFPQMDGWISLKSTQGNSFLTVPRDQLGTAQLRCEPRQAGRLRDATFLLRLLEQQQPAV